MPLVSLGPPSSNVHPSPPGTASVQLGAPGQGGSTGIRSLPLLGMGPLVDSTYPPQRREVPPFGSSEGSLGHIHEGRLTFLTQPLGTAGIPPHSFTPGAEGI